MLHLLFEDLGLVIGGFNILTIIYLWLNIFGGILGLLLAGLTIKIINSYKYTNKIKAKLLN
ncbi:hypothetical protein BK130_10735 [Viridibacillus sp. FSL H8-0123]|uniref:Uncharacterized protein n=1 Tax=Viridibacillus arenosi FSL R5-213 TaxID=1227360 RepID=W4F3N1_9BACL|nr:hypothetical protein C176_04463 [Viridibacillus arenosi FSL R5-213]OMC82445.1 hypothetical protein BK130_10735 [Viridibacillus sp. FSL H8-0123]OMC91355.1 hypothetical protein BK137_09775 [Viridibacillus arenosi]